MTRYFGWKTKLGARLRRHYAAPLSPERAHALEHRLHTQLSAAGVLGRVGTPTRRSRHRMWMAVLVVTALAAATAAGVYAVASVLDLGKPTNQVSTNSTFPLSGFHRLAQALAPSKGKATLIFIGTQFAPPQQGFFYDQSSAVERWPVVKALTQFGSLSNISPLTRTCYLERSIGQNVCHDPTFNWARARYRSTYLMFAHVDLVDDNGKLFQRPSSRELALYNRYVRVRHSQLKNDPYNVMNTIFSRYTAGSRQFPLIAIGDYVQTESQVLPAGDLEEILSGPPAPQGAISRNSGLPFDTIRQALASGQDPKLTRLNEDVNAEANIITALICHADGMQPGKVCDRAVVKTILKHIK
jgi:hypothetical protein